MSDKTIFEILGIPQGADPTLVERLFLNRLSATTKEASQDYSEDSKKQTLEQIEFLYNKLHDYFITWVAEQRAANRSQEDPAYANTKKIAEDMLMSTRGYMINIAQAAFELERYAGQLETEASEMGEITKEALVEASRTGTEIGSLFTKNTNKKVMIQEKLQKYKDAYDLVKTIDDNLGKIQKILESLYGVDKAAAPMRSIASALRTENYTRIRTVFREIKEAKEKSLLGGNKSKEIEQIDTLLKDIVQIMQENSKLVMSEDHRMMLHVEEVSAVHNDILDSLAAIKTFMVKNYVIYLRHKLVSMKGLQQQLDTTATSKELLGLYRKLGTCVAEPITDLKQSRFFENDVIEPAQRQIQNNAPAIQHILERANNMMDELRMVQIEFAQLSTMSLNKL